MLRRLVLLILCLLLVSCAGSNPRGPAAPIVTSPEGAHELFIQALQTNDRQQALKLVGDSLFKAGRVDTWLSNATALQRTSATNGPFRGVQVLLPIEQGQEATAMSVWQHERGNTCYLATLAQTEDAWHVVDWRSVGPDTCPKP